MFLLVSIPTDVNDNRRHVHVFRKGGRHLRSIANIWIKRDGEKCVEIATSELSAKDNDCERHRTALGIHQRANNQDVQWGEDGSTEH